MKKKWGIIGTIFIIFCIGLINIQREPKIVSCITTTDTAYLTVLANRSCFADKEAVAQEIIDMCRENAFDDIKLSIENSAYLQTFYITVYRNKMQMSIGKELMTIKYIISEEIMKVL